MEWQSFAIVRRQCYQFREVQLNDEKGTDLKRGISAKTFGPKDPNLREEKIPTDMWGGRGQYTCLSRPHKMANFQH